MKIKNIRKKGKGFTLVEILVSLAIMSVMIIPIMNMFIQSGRTQSRTEEDVIGMNIALQKMEEYRYLGFQTLKERLDTIRESGQESYTSSTPVDNYPSYRRIITINYYPDVNPTNLEGERRIAIEVNVSWKPKTTSKTVTKRLFTIVTDRSPFL